MLEIFRIRFNFNRVSKAACILALAFAARALFGQSFAVPSAVTLSSRAAETIAGPPIYRFESGVLAADVRLGCTSGASCTAPQFAVGTGGAFNFNQHFAIDTSLLTLLNSAPAGQLSGGEEGGRGTEFLLGGRAEIRGRRFGFFAVEKPGMVSFSSAMAGANFTPAGNGTLNVAYQYQRRTSFADEAGGGLEYSPSPRVHVRIQMADLLVRNNDAVRYDVAGIIVPTCMGSCTRWTNSLQTTAGVYLSAGRPVAWGPSGVREGSEHPFFDATNRMLIAASLLGQAADAITTQRFLRHGIAEGNPLAEPFVKYGWSGQIALAALSNLAEIGGMRAMHRMHMHRMERLIPLSLASTSALMAYRNQQLSDRPSQ